VWGVKLLPNEKQLANAAAILKALEFDSVTSYVWVHHVGMTQFPFTPYARVAETAAGQWAKLETDHGLPYYPNVSMGWDPSPRTVQTDVYSNEGYPFTPILDGNTPAAFRASLQAARAWLESDPRRPRILNINAWNEWTEGSYLEPDTTTGTEYLEAVRAVFGGR
jgi:hypothetical protein